MDVFTQLVLKYVEAVGKLAKDQADLGERNVVNLHDIISAFAHLRPRADLESLNAYSLESLVRFAHDPESERSLNCEVPNFPVQKNAVVRDAGEAAPGAFGVGWGWGGGGARSEAAGVKQEHVAARERG